MHTYILSDQGLLILLKGYQECLHHTEALEGSREDKGYVACAVLYSFIPMLPVKKAESSQSLPLAILGQMGGVLS